MSIRHALSLLLFSAFMMEADAQAVATDTVATDTVTTTASHQSIPKRLNQKITKMYFNSKYDTAYVERPKEKWLLRLMLNQTGNHIMAEGTVNDVWSEYDLHTKYNTNLSLEINYCDLAVSLSLNPAKVKGNYDDYEFNFEYHGQAFSFDIDYQRATSLTGDMKLGNINHLNEDGLRMNVVNLATYYVFNNRRFSFPAALYQNYYQLRSAGSWLAGLSFQGGSIKTTEELKARSPQAPEVHLTFANVGIGAGYGYNFVFGRHSQWLLHVSEMPTFVVYKHNKLTVNNENKKDSRASLNLIFNQRASLVYHFSPRYNIGSSLLLSHSLFNDSKVVVRQNKWLARVFLGMRL